ncbi:2OG-Fe(II) oxygenase [Futiania mangrovi]|uniref:2OG-Fe(II) oxygenase n=1 Tax=Futiania mangrovi TaxID=2959716 RepID=A0A9J6PHF5_9PROT|nr:2OG-Fe(II) oxygenase [Futiania mangrovii]MCP1336007.1 2OG-Fe(II) oxygenase [Futiania mangrovii]
MKRSGPRALTRPGKGEVRQEAPPPEFAAVIGEVFSERECLALRDLVDLGGDGYRAGLVGGREADGVRRSTIAWIPETPEWHWVEARMARLMAEAQRITGLEIEALEERLQIARYGAEHRDGFDWHSDRGAGTLARRRKLSVSVQLSSTVEYRGGHLEVIGDGRTWRAPRAMGTAIVFASFLTHRVTPVTHGVRHSLVGWAHGNSVR